MSRCHVVKVKHKIYPFMVITEEENPMEYLERISFELYKHGIQNKRIIFDNLLFSGDTDDRFFDMIFDGKMFVIDSLVKKTVPKKNAIRQATVRFLQTNQITLNNSVLSSIQKLMINKGISI